MTLIELLISISMMALMAASLGVVARTVQMTSAYTEGYSTATQHARVSFERISRMVSEATASESFPGAAVFATTVGSYRYPDTLVVWHPTTTAANPTGLPQFRELVVYTFNSSDPSQFLEITNPADSRTVPALTSTGTWATELTNLRNSTTATKTLLTDLVRTANASSGTSGIRAAVRFELELRPTAAEVTSYRNGTLAWENMSWAQGIYGSQTGLRQAWVRGEMQLLPSTGAAATRTSQVPAAFFGSAALYSQLSK